MKINADECYTKKEEITTQGAGGEDKIQVMALNIFPASQAPRYAISSCPLLVAWYLATFPPISFVLSHLKAYIALAVSSQLTSKSTL